MTATDLTRTAHPAPAERVVRGHEHGWAVESSHPTSEGLVLYVRCGCGVRRVDRVGDDVGVPWPQSREIPASVTT